jgi:putative phosphoribosyl transferase
MAVLPFSDRGEAGQLLGRRVVGQVGTDAIVLGLPRGGVVVAAEVARVLDAPLDAYVVRKLPLPGHPELAMGAVAGPVTVWYQPVLDQFRPTGVDAVVTTETAELRRRELAYRGGRPPPDLTGRDVVLVDDGVATGSTAEAAIRAVRVQRPTRLVFATPVIPAHVRLGADAVVSIASPTPFGAVGSHYLDFRQTTDAEVRQALDNGQRT